MIVLEICDSVITGVQAIRQLKPDLVFLDIQMPNENGFGLFKYFDKVNFEVIFTTAYKDYAIDAIIDQPGNKIGEVAVQYLLNEIRNEQQFFNKTIVIRTNLIVRDLHHSKRF